MGRAGALLWLFLSLLAVTAIAQEKLDLDADDPELAALANTRWSMIFPERDFEGGCIQGFFAFRFSATGYFTFDNRLQGSWRVDQRGTITLKTRQGNRFTLMREDNQLRLMETLRVRTGGSVWRLQRNSRFQKCPNE